MTSPIRCLCLLVACLIALAAQAGRAGSQQPDETSTERVYLQGRALSDKEGPFLGLGVTYFQALRHAKLDRARLEKNLALFVNRGFNYIRVLSMVSWDELEIAPVSFTNRQGRLVEGWPDYWDHFRDLLDIAAKHRLRVEVTIFADAQVVMPSLAARQAHLDELLKNIAGREQHILFLEVANEAWQNGFPGEEGVRDLRRAAQYLAERTDVLVAITSNDDTSNAGICELYRGSAADLATVHFSRDARTAEGGWLPVRDAFRAGSLDGVPPVISNEPIGPGSSVAEERDPLKLCSAAVVAYLANLPAYVYHTRAGVFGYARCCPPEGEVETFESTPGIDAFLHLRRLLPADLPNWERNDGLEPSAPLTVFCQNEPNRYWTEAPTAVDGCHRNIGARNGNEFICYPMGILKNGVWLQARVPLRMEVIDPLTGKQVLKRELGVGQRLHLSPGPGAYICRGCCFGRPARGDRP
jgi:hypothetical protein